MTSGDNVDHLIAESGIMGGRSDVPIGGRWSVRSFDRVTKSQATDRISRTAAQVPQAVAYAME